MTTSSRSEHPHYDRRTFLRRAGLATASVALLAGLPRPAAAQDAGLAPFLHGVASGDPVADGVILWTRLTTPDGAPADVTWRVALDVDMRQVVREDVFATDASRDHTVKVDVRGLEANRWYFYEFEALGGRSIVGRTRTAPVGGIEQMRFGVVSCSNYQGGFFNAYARLAERNDLDAIFHLGDYIYEYGNGTDRYGPGTGTLSAPRDHQPPTEMVTLADYRLRHGNYKFDPDLRRLHQLYPWVVTWDDHESTNNSRRDSAQNHQPAEGDWQVRKAASQRAYSEWMPIRADDPAKIYRNLRFGDLFDLVVMDTRLEGRDLEVGTTGATILSGPAIDDPNRKLISEEQRTMVFNSLSAPGALWKVIAQQVILGQWNAGGAPLLPALPDQPVFKSRTGGNALNPDQWDGYTAERARLFKHIRSTPVKNVVVLTGDVHTSWALDLTEDPYNPLTYNPVTGAGALGVEFVTPSISSANFESLGVAGVAAFEAATRVDNPHVKFVDFDGHGYLVLDVNRKRVQSDWYFVDTVTRPSNNQALAASWETRVGEGFVRQASAAAPKGADVAAIPGPTPRPVQVQGATLGSAPANSGGSGSGGRAVAAPPALPVTGGAFQLAAAGAAIGVGLVAKVIDRRVRIAAAVDETRLGDDSEESR